MNPDEERRLTEFRATVRRWVAENRVEGLPKDGDVWTREVGPEMAEWLERLRRRGWLCLHWPVEYGGAGMGPLELAVLDEEFAVAGVPRPMLGFGEALVGPAIIAHGTEEQRRRLLPRIVSREDVYCQGFSEPDAGSDLAGVRTRGVVDGDTLTITGQKTWTSEAHGADMCFVLCRTDPDAPKHKGLSFVLVPMTGNGVEVRPIRQMDGRRDYSEVYFDGSRAQVADVIGGLGNGWKVTMTTLGAERSMGYAFRHFEFLSEFREVLEVVRKDGRDGDPLVRQGMAEAYTLLEAVRFLGRSELDRLTASEPEGPEMIMYKLLWSEAHRRMGEIYMDVVGPRAALRPPGEDYTVDTWHDVLFKGQAETIYAGTSEIQRNIIAERLLGLPRR
ncbi:acyl-CoA dehydrogenase [Streptosporangium violaceochromogenes]|nr:acyl-CoA dehydrogenase [Streptosporangium violaceochromogenes]